MNAVMIWFIVGGVLMVAELFTPAFILVFFGIGAWAAGLTAVFWPGLEREIVVCLVVAIASLLFLRQRLVSVFQGRSTNARDSARSGAPEFPHIGRQAQVTRAIPAGGEGEISLGGSYWRATSPVAVAEGGTVRVLQPVDNDELLLMVQVLESSVTSDEEMN